MDELRRQHQQELATIRQTLDVTEDASILDLAEHVRARLDTHEEIDRRILGHLVQQPVEQLRMNGSTFEDKEEELGVSSYMCD